MLADDTGGDNPRGHSPATALLWCDEKVGGSLSYTFGGGGAGTGSPSAVTDFTALPPTPAVSVPEFKSTPMRGVRRRAFRPSEVAAVATHVLYLQYIRDVQAAEGMTPADRQMWRFENRDRLVCDLLVELAGGREGTSTLTTTSTALRISVAEELSDASSVVGIHDDPARLLYAGAQSPRCRRGGRRS